MFKQIAAAIARVIASIPKRVLRAGKWVWQTVPPVIHAAVQYPFSTLGNVFAPRVDGSCSAASNEDAISDRNADLAKQLIQQAGERKEKRLTTAELAIEYADAVLEGRRVLPDVSRLPERSRVWIELLRIDRNAAVAVAKSNTSDVADHVAGLRNVSGFPALPTDEYLAEVRKGYEYALREIEISSKYREHVTDDDPHVKFV